jgi:hypothetical protein
VADLVLHASPVDAWLDTLDEAKQAAVLEYAAAERSVVLGYLYARMLGLGASIDEFEAWANRRWKRLDHEAILETEIVSLQLDLQNLRAEVSQEGPSGDFGDEGRPRKRRKGVDEIATRISYLSRELRSSLESLRAHRTLQDRRALLLAGVEVTRKYLSKVYGRDATIWPAIESILESAYAEIDGK